MENLESNNKLKKYNNYSKDNGIDYTGIYNNNLTIKKNESNTCPKCNFENNTVGIYCKKCGNNLEEINEYKKYDKYKFITRETIVTSAIAIGVLFLISIILKFLLISKFGELSNIINPLQIMMILNFSSTEVYATTMIGTGAVSAKFSILLLIISPIIAISLSNMLFNNKNDSSPILHKIIGVGITYGLMIATISIFASSRIVSRDMLESGVYIKYKYNIFSAFINGFIIASLSTYLVSFKKKDNKKDPYRKIIDISLMTIGIGYMMVILVLLITIISDNTYLYELGLYGYSKEFSMSLVITQLAAYLWGFANFIPVSLGNLNLSAFGIINSELFFYTKLIFYSMLALSILILLIAGYKLKEVNKNTDIKHVLVFAVSYAIFMGILATFTTIAIGGSISIMSDQGYETNIVMGLPIMITMVISFIYSFLISLLGYKLNVIEEYE